MTACFYSCLIAFGVLQAAAWLIYAIWLPPYIARHGERQADLAAHALSGADWLRDYQTAAAIRRQTGRCPWFLRTFEILQILAVAFFLGGIVCTVWEA